MCFLQKSFQSTCSKQESGNIEQHEISIFSPANLSLATKKYMRKYGLLVQQDDDSDKENGRYCALIYCTTYFNLLVSTVLPNLDLHDVDEKLLHEETFDQVHKLPLLMHNTSF